MLFMILMPNERREKSIACLERNGVVFSTTDRGYEEGLYFPDIQTLQAASHVLETNGLACYPHSGIRLYVIADKEESCET